MKQFFEEQWPLLIGIMSALIVSIGCQIFITYYMLQMVKASEKMEEETQKIFKDWVEEYFKDKRKITNISVYLNTKLQQLCIGKYKITHIKHLAGQALLFAIFLAGAGACKGIIDGKTVGQVLPFYIISLFGMYLYFSLSGIMDLEGKKKVIQMNLLDFLENSKSYLYTSYDVEKETEEKRTIFGEKEDEELKEIIREILV